MAAGSVNYIHTNDDDITITVLLILIILFHQEFIIISYLPLIIF